MKHNIKKTELNCENCNQKFLRRNDKIELYKQKCNNKVLCKNCYGGFNRKLKLKSISENPLVKPNEFIKGQKNPNFTITCKYCNKEFIVPYMSRYREFCSKSCQVKGSPKIKIEIKHLCKICNKEFEHYGASIACSKECYSKYMSQARIAENNPNWIPREEMDKSKCLNCGIIFAYGRKNLHKGQKKYFCSIACSKKTGGGVWFSKEEKEKAIINSNNYDLFIEYVPHPYPKIFDNKLKEKIKNKNNNCCQLCENKENLHIHHIDYNKQNCNEENLTTLCQKCHNISNHNRQFWTQVFIGLKSNSKIVKKGWGLEIHFINNSKYCLKYLVFFKGKKFSLHKHLIKQELWFCQWGTFECLIRDNNKENYFLLKQGDKIEIMPNVEHQLRALTNCIITEVSTTDYPEDSIRIENGD